MKYFRAGGAALTLLGLLLGAPILLVQLGRWPDWARGWALLLTPDDGSVLAAIVTLIGWVAWAVFAASVAAEVAEVVTAGRVRFTPAFMRVPRALAGVLVAAVVAVLLSRSGPTSPTAPPPAIHSTQQEALLGAPSRPSALAAETDPSLAD